MHPKRQASLRAGPLVNNPCLVLASLGCMCRATGASGASAISSSSPSSAFINVSNLHSSIVLSPLVVVVKNVKCVNIDH